MLAVSLSADELGRRLTPGVEIAAVNAPALCTVSGKSEAIASFAAQLANAGVEHRTLHTSHAFHSAMMEPVLASFREIVAKVRLSAPTRRYLSNVTGTWMQPEQATSPDYYVQHLRRAVQFAAGVQQLAAEQCVLLEVGPGNALTSLARLTLGRERSTLAVASMPHPKESRSETETTLGAVGRMWTLGAALDWDGFHTGERLGRVPLPTYPFDRKRHWVEARRSMTQGIAPNAEQPSTSNAQLTPDAIAAARRENVDDWFYSESWLRIPLPASTARLDGESWLVFGDRDALTDAVRARLVEFGAEVVSVERGDAFARADDARFVVRPQERDDYAAVLREVKHRTSRLAGAVHLWNVGGNDARRADDVDAFQQLAALAGALSLGAANARLPLVVATSGAQSVGQELIERPDRAMLTGVTLVLPEEHEGVIARLVDVDSKSYEKLPALTAQQLVDEARAPDGEAVIARRAGQRWARRHVQTPLSAAPRENLPLREERTVSRHGGIGRDRPDDRRVAGA